MGKTYDLKTEEFYEAHFIYLMSKLLKTLTYDHSPLASLGYLKQPFFITKLIVFFNSLSTGYPKQMVNL